MTRFWKICNPPKYTILGNCIVISPPWGDVGWYLCEEVNSSITKTITPSIVYESKKSLSVYGLMTVQNTKLKTKYFWLERLLNFKILLISVHCIQNFWRICIKCARIQKVDKSRFRVLHSHGKPRSSLLHWACLGADQLYCGKLRKEPAAKGFD